MDALEIGLRALEIGTNDEVITTPMTAFATVLAIMRAGATPVLADIDPDTAMLDPESVRRCLTAKTKAIVLVHLYGQAGPIDAILAIAKDHKIHLIEDCAQAHGARYKGQLVGSFGSVGAWSFYPTKNLGAIGDAGAVATSSGELAAKARALRHYGQTELHHHQLLGMNSRLDELQAAILRVRLQYLAGWTQRRREIAKMYHANMCNPQVRLLPAPAEAERHVHHLFVITCQQRDALQAHLKAQGVESLSHYPLPVHKQEVCRSIPHDSQGLKQAERHAASCLSLPCHPGLPEVDIERVIQAVNSF
jgi:dTDP-4-amino-4,6-dideoxygalactose transaminase